MGNAGCSSAFGELSAHGKREPDRAHDRAGAAGGPAVLAIGCVLVLRPFFTAVCFALILVVATWPAFERLKHLLGGRKTLAALLIVTLATLVFVMQDTPCRFSAPVRTAHDLVGSSRSRPPGDCTNLVRICSTVQHVRIPQLE
jgi:hypothetical protein